MTEESPQTDLLRRIALSLTAARCDVGLVTIDLEIRKIAVVRVRKRLDADIWEDFNNALSAIGFYYFKKDNVWRMGVLQ